MPKIKELKKLTEAFEVLQETLESARELVEEKRSWLESRSEAYQDSDKGIEWAEYLDEAEMFIDELEALDLPDSFQE